MKYSKPYIYKKYKKPYIYMKEQAGYWQPPDIVRYTICFNLNKDLDYFDYPFKYAPARILDAFIKQPRKLDYEYRHVMDWLLKNVH